MKTPKNEHYEYQERGGLDRKRIFISYCWESEEHKKWVHELAEDLSEDFEVKIDQKVPLGMELTYFMENATVLEQEYLENGVRLVVNCHKGDADKYSEYLL